MAAINRMKEHLKGLDTLRAIAALVVVIGHIELIKKNNNITSFDYAPSGHIAVVLFFVLSGFLITFLLSKELDSTSTISFKKFYMRRILRIWPLYYLILLISILIIPAKQSIISYILCFTIFPNVAHAIGEGWASSPQIWSIGVEEQFYLLWPIILYFIFFLNKRLIVPILLTLIVTYTVLPHLLGFINVRYFQSESMYILETLFYVTKYNCIALGSCIGLLYARRNSWIQIFNSNTFLVIITSLAASMWLFRFEHKYFTDEIFAVLFAILILGVIGSKTFNIDSTLTKFLGKISYGIYMYHWLVILIVIELLPIEANIVSYNFKLYGIVLTTTILISYLSYSFFEKRFLNLKSKYRIEKSH